MYTLNRTDRPYSISLRTWLPVLLLLLGSVHLLSAQEGNVLTNLKSDLRRADALYDSYSYQAAARLYKEALKKEPDNARIKLRLAECYRKLNDWKNAEVWYAQVMKEKSVTEPIHLYNYAQALFNNQKYAEAGKWYEDYQAAVGPERRVANKLWGLQNIPRFYQDSAFYRIAPLSVNTPQSDFSPAYYRDGVVYISAAEKAPLVRQVYTWDETALLDMYYATTQPGGKLSKPSLFYSEINTRYHEGPAVFYDQGSKMIFTRSSLVSGKLQKNAQGINRLSLFSADQAATGKAWTNIKPLSFSGTDYTTGPDYSVGHPAVTTDGRTLYFVSDMPGGQGGLDIYVSRLEGSTWSKPLNLGPDINTEGNEMFPFIHRDSVLYFASDGYAGLGGLDIYRTSLGQSAAAKVVNLGYPINSTADDFGLILNTVGKEGYFTSNRAGGKGSDDLYQFTVTTVIIEAIVSSAKDGKPIPTSQVTLQNSASGQELTGAADGNKVYFEVMPGEHFILKSNASGFEPKTQVLTTRNWPLSDTLVVNVDMNPVQPVSARLVARIIDQETKLAVPGARIFLMDEMTSDAQEITTDSAGLLTFEALFASSYSIVAETDKKSGIAAGVVAQGTATSAQDTLTIFIAPFGKAAGSRSPGLLTIDVEVTDKHTQAALAGADVRLFDKNTRKEHKFSTKNGTVKFKVPVGNYILKVFKTTYTEEVAAVSMQNALIDNRSSDAYIKLPIELQKEQTLVPVIAFVYDPETGEPQAGFPLFLLDEATSEDTQAVSDQNGNYRFAAKPGASYAIIAEKGNVYGFVSGAAIPVATKHTGSTATEHVIQVPVFRRTAKQDLVAAMPDSAPGQTSGDAQKSDSLTGQKPTSALSTASAVIVKGFTTDPATGEVLAGAFLTLIESRSQEVIHGTLKDGHYYFAVAPGKNYLMKSSAIGYMSKTVLVNTRESKAGDSLTVQVEAAKVRPVVVPQVVHVYDQVSGAPVADATIVLLDETTSDVNQHSTDAQGNFQFMALTFSSYAVIAEKEGKQGFFSMYRVNSALTLQDTIMLPIAGPYTVDNQKIVSLTVQTSDLNQGSLLWNTNIRLIDGITRKEIKGIQTNSGLTFEVRASSLYILSGSKPGYEEKNILVTTKGLSQGDTVSQQLLMESKKPLSKILLVQIYDEKTRQAEPGVNVLLVDETTGEMKTMTTNRYGKFEFEAFFTASYLIIADKNDKSSLVSVSDSLVSATEIISVPLRRPFAKPGNDQIGVPVVTRQAGRNQAGRSQTAATATIAPADNEQQLVQAYRLENIGGNEQTFVFYKKRLFEFKADENLKYLIPVETRQELIVGQDEDPAGTSLLQQLQKALAGTDMPLGEMIHIRNVFFKVNESALTAEAKAELDKLAKVLQANPVLKLMISSHADSRESATYNFDLSVRRSKAVIAYLQAQKISKRRIRNQAFGEKRPVNHCIDGVECAEAEHAKNRRTEFRLFF